MIASKRPVLILGWISRIVLPIARSLHRHGIPVDAADCVDAPRIIYRSRAIREFVRIPYPPFGMDEFVTGLRDFIIRNGHDMLIPTDDLALTAVIECYDDFKDLVHIACPPPAVTRRVLNKASTLELAQKCGIRVPKTITVSNSTQLSELADSFPFPWILKPVEKEKQLEKFKSRAFATAHDVNQEFPQPREFKPAMLLQEYCHGVGVGVEMLFHQGECIAVFQHRRLKELPYDGGVSVTAVSEAPDPGLVQQSLTLLRALQWEGVAMVEFKVNPADGQAVLMEVNGRYWGTISLPIRAKMDFPLYHWKVLHGEPVDIPKTYAVGTKWRWTVGCIGRMYDLLAVTRYSAAARKALPAELFHFSEDFSTFIPDSTFTISDPLPAIVEFIRAMKYYIWHIQDVVLGKLPGTKPGER